MDIVYLQGIEVDCVIGVWDWEREITQRLSIDLDMGCDLSLAGESDDLNDTINYQQAAKAVNELCIEKKAKLVESLAVSIADLLLQDFGCLWCKVKINKTGALRGAKNVGVIIERSKSDS